MKREKHNTNCRITRLLTYKIYEPIVIGEIANAI